jgi:hypothetical protein
MKLIPILALGFLTISGLVSCDGTDSSCRNGRIAIDSQHQLPKTQSESAADSNQLPAPFNYTVQQMVAAVSGIWLTMAGDTAFQLSIPDDANIEYNLAVGGTKCGPTVARLDIIGATANSLGGKQIGGLFTLYDSLTTGEVDIAIEGSSCALAFSNRASESMAILYGNCSLFPGNPPVDTLYKTSE